MITGVTSKKLPDIADVGRLLAMLFGGETRCQSRRQPLMIADAAILAIYHDSDAKLKRAVICDLAFANSAGAALSLISPGVANGATKAKKLADAALDNLSEVMNVAVNLFTESFGGRLELTQVYNCSSQPEELAKALSSNVRTKVDVTIPRYDLGRVDLIALE